MIITLLRIKFFFIYVNCEVHYAVKRIVKKCHEMNIKIEDNPQK